jgi:signal peptidase II
MRGSSLVRLVLSAGAVAGLDQIIKAAITARLELYQVIVLVPGLLNLTYIRNTGGAFGLLADLDPSLAFPLFAGATVAAVGVLGYIYLATPPKKAWTRLGCMLVLGGALGNLVDRVRFRQVIDFIDLHWGAYHWPAFNLADCAITVGVALIVLEAFLWRSRALEGEGG